MEPLIQPFINYLQFEKRYSGHTIRAYQDDLVQFFDYVGLQFGLKELTEVSPSIIRSWLASLKDGGISSRSINRKISSLRSYYKFQIKGGVVEQSPMLAITSPKASKRLPAYVEQQDMATLFANIEFPDNWDGWTERLVMSVLYQTGMRLSELINLRERQVDGNKRVIKVLGKGNKERIIPLNPALVEQIRDYCVKKGKELEKPDREYLLVGHSGKKLYPKYVYRVVHKYLSLITTIDQKSPHVLRHTFATHLSNAGAELNSIKELLGHSNLAATQIYTHNTIEKLKDIHKKAHPKA